MIGNSGRSSTFDLQLFIPRPIVELNVFLLDKIIKPMLLRVTNAMQMNILNISMAKRKSLEHIWAIYGYLSDCEDLEYLYERSICPSHFKAPAVK